jgi:mRNA-degrading endonuclease toxin of MazEF toxin-antitoxin module
VANYGDNINTRRRCISRRSDQHGKGDAPDPLRLRILAVGDLAQDSDLLLEQLQAIDNNCLVKGPLQRCPETFMTQVDQALREVLDLK